MKNNFPQYDPSLLTVIGRTSKADIYVDFNMGWLRDFLTFNIGYGPKHIEFSELNNSDMCSESFELAKIARDFILSYAVDGRKTIKQSIAFYFRFLADSNLTIFDADSIVQYCNHLKVLVQSTQIVHSTARLRLSTASLFSVKCGAIVKPYQYNFHTRLSGRGMKTGTNYYKPHELGLIMHLTLRFWEAYESILNDVLDKIDEGVMPISFFEQKTNMPFPISLEIDDTSYDYHILAFNFINNYMSLTFIMFTYYTLSRPSISVELEVDDIVRNNNGSIDTKPSLKGRGFKFVRFGMGKSTIDIDKGGLKLFEKFLKTRERICRYIESSGVYSNLSSDKRLRKMFFTESAKLGSVSSINNTQVWVNNFGEKHLWKLKQEGVVLPALNIKGLIKSAEMLLEDESDNPSLLVEKSQHEYDTYTESYGRGNPITNLREMSNALNVIADGSSVQQSLEERQKQASEKGFQLIDKVTSNISVSANGLGCDRNKPENSIERAFLRQARQSSYQPKQCMDLVQCMGCNKCAVIEDIDCLYELLSFRQAIMLNKGVYRGSKMAETEYEEIVIKLNEVLELVDAGKLNAAQQKLDKEGVSEIWNIKI